MTGDTSPPVSRSETGDGTPLLQVSGLQISFDTPKGTITAVRDVSFTVHRGEILGIVGETGSGKSITCKALTRLLPRNAHIEGSAVFHGENLLELSKQQLRNHRGNTISMIAQDPMGSLNPIKSLLGHMREAILRTLATGSNQSRTRRPDAEHLRQIAIHRLEAAHLATAADRIQSYPFELSGGMAQRVQIAMAMCGKAQILIADEPTTALDVTIQANILEELVRLSKEQSLAVIIITHDLSIVASICNRMAVMYHGRIVESGPVSTILAAPAHPYTKALLDSAPVMGNHLHRLKPIVGDILGSEIEVPGCDFAPRCPYARTVCTTEKPSQWTIGGRTVYCTFPLDNHVGQTPSETKPERQIDLSTAILEVQDLTCRFSPRANTKTRKDTIAVDSVSCSVYRGEIFGIVGESGSGKSTLARAVMGLLAPTSGRVLFNGLPVPADNQALFTQYTQHVQYVFQDPLGALDPRMTILEQTMEPLLIHKKATVAESKRISAEILGECGLNETFHHRKPYNLSGGQRQRVVLARALVNNPELLICDEPVSALDVSVQAQILNLIEDLASKRSMTVLFISHDLSVINNICDRVAVMYAGHIVEIGSMESVFAKPAHPYSRLLMQSIPHPGKADSSTSSAWASPSSPTTAQPHQECGCLFAPRCPVALPLCYAERPRLLPVGKAATSQSRLANKTEQANQPDPACRKPLHEVACHNYGAAHHDC